MWRVECIELQSKGFCYFSEILPLGSGVLSVAKPRDANASPGLDYELRTVLEYPCLVLSVGLGLRDPGGAGLAGVKSSGHAFHLHSIKKLTYFTVLLSINMGHAGGQLLPLLSLYSSLLPFLIFTPFRHMHMVLIFPCNSLLARLDIFSHLLLPHFLHVCGLPWIGF